MTRYSVLATFSLASLLAGPLSAQTSAVPLASAAVEPFAFATAHVAPADPLPDAPSAVMSSSAAPADTFADDQAKGSGPKPLASKYATIILPGQDAVELHGMEKAALGLRDSFSLPSIVGFTVSAGFSHLIDSQPHYGRNAQAFGKREGAAALRSTIQTMSTDAVFAPMFHDDPRYYVMGRGHHFVDRAVYAATRVIITRSSHSNHQRINAPLLLGYGVAAGANNAFYPDQDRGAKNTMQNWATSLGGAALGFEVSEFLDDALRMVHIRKD